MAALESKTEVRAKMRAWSAKQRFPVAQWLEGLEKLQGRSIKLHNKTKLRSKRKLNVNTAGSDGGVTPLSSRNLTPNVFTPNNLTPASAFFNNGSRPVSPTANWPLPPSGASRPQTPDFGASHQRFPSSGLHSHNNHHQRDDSDAESVYSDTSTLAPPRFLGEGGSEYSPNRRGLGTHHNLGSTASFASVVSVDSIVQGRTDFKLQQVDPFFTDSDGKFYSAFEKRLDKGFNGKTSLAQLCIEEYLVESEREYFDRMRDVKLGTGHARYASTANLVDGGSRVLGRKRRSSSFGMAYSKEELDRSRREEYGLGGDYVPPTGLKK